MNRGQYSNKKNFENLYTNTHNAENDLMKKGKERFLTSVGDRPGLGRPRLF
jgi:hypothetical protein